jgi:hypothetical protein
MIPVIGPLLDIGKTWLDGFNQKQKAKQDLDLAELNNKQRLLLDTESNNHAWEMANLTDKDKWLRRISFVMFASPFIIAFFAPDQVRYYFEIAIANVPNWWTKTFMSITGGIWGISSLKNVLPAVVSGLKKTLKA